MRTRLSTSAVLNLGSYTNLFCMNAAFSHNKAESLLSALFVLDEG